ncbi:hypothetical protein BJ741DRAFT_675741 [Chytriomyces cf. hyalinus JEL632]|nr:hypothetical protein BJ741DRAFT_679453 [Chytriomyces cf. hyalinus JEL632]KAI8824656.1 hypothetical protein BJ741DRAFT_671855 [Chytriomyces cf. hyalinus JEL632]KAI8829304.1 hypothetical protein BJ741DRAFT_699191 [Chytriomyces cf. hyalinus JEL632]KAI8840864.1 hypothetical protein BJ741DRAFT_675741 [Chytriomyces cf. hyalinus JEL632]
MDLLQKLTIAIDWSQPLGFKYRHPCSHFKCMWAKVTGWDSGKLLSNHTIIVDQQVSTTTRPAFKGNESFPHERRQNPNLSPRPERATLSSKSCKAASMECPPAELFLEALQRVISDNLDHVPPTDSAGSVHSEALSKHSLQTRKIEPLHMELETLISAETVLQYLLQPPPPQMQKGFAVNLFLGPQTHSKVEEFATSNFAGSKLAADGKTIYVTPRSESVLKGVTNQPCADTWHGMSKDAMCLGPEVKEFEEVVATGTAVVMTVIGEIHREVKTNRKAQEEEADAKLEMEVVKFDKEPVKFKKLFTAVIELQKGIPPGWEAYGWMWPPEGLLE